MKIALICDSHFGARGDNRELLNSMVEFYQNVFFPSIKEHGCEHIIHLGDLVDRRKYINFNTLNLLRTEFLDKITIPMDIICGNHDTYFKNTNQLNALDELIATNEYPLINIFTTSCVQPVGDQKFLYIPWLTEDNIHHLENAMEDLGPAYAFGHLELTGFQMIKGMQCTHGINHKTFTKYQHVFSGHFHVKSSRDNITYLGAPYAMNWAEAEDPHGFHIFDTETGELTHILNESNMFVKLFYDAETDHTVIPNVARKWVKLIVKEKPDPYLFDNYAKALQDQEPLELRVVEPITQVSEEVVVSEADDTNVIIDKSIDARLDLEEDARAELKRLMHDLYKQASELIIER